MEKYNYYLEQLKKVSTSGEYAPKIKIMGGNTLDEHTNWMDLNKESAAEIVKWLNDNYLSK